MRKHSPPHVALLIETSRAYGRGLLRGIARYLHEHGPWSIFFRPQGLDAPPPWLRDWRGQGILARIGDRRMARTLLATGLPLVDLRNAVAGLGLPGIGPDNRAVAQLAFEHFCASGIHSFAFCNGPRGENRFLDLRGDAFAAAAEAAGAACHRFEPPPGAAASASWERRQSQLARWLKSLPKPVGVLACNDDLGQQVLDACLRAGLAVPDEVAVVGVDNDEHLCGLSNPPLSSIDVYPEGIGYAAAAMLDRWMQGMKPAATITELPPQGMVVRQSSDVVGVADPLVAAAARLVRERACQGLSVGEMAARLDVSQSTLERRFAAILGRTPKQEILRVQIAAASRLLAAGDLPVAAVAGRTGFRSAAYFSEVFHRSTSVTPSQYRRQFAGGGRGPAERV